MEERLLVKDQFLKYVNALESDDMNLLDEVLSKDVVLESTNYGNAIGLSNVKAKLKWQGVDINVSRYKIFNFVAFTENEVASQSAVVTALVGWKEETYLYYFNFGGYYLNDWTKEDGIWKIKHIRFNLDLEDGNSLFVKDWWNLIDYRYFEGIVRYPIISEVNNPWINIKNPESLGSEEEQVLDSYYRYSWGIDHGDFDLFQTCLADECYLFEREKPSNKEEIIAFMKYKRYKEAIMEHIWKIDSVEIKGNRAVLKTRRYEPHRMGTTKFNILNMYTDFYTGKFEYEFKKVNGKNYRDGGWKMISNRCVLSKVIGENTYDKSKFF